MLQHLWDTFPGFNEWMLALGVPFAGMASALILIVVVGPARLHGRHRREPDLEAATRPSQWCPRRVPRGLTRLAVEQERNGNLLRQRSETDTLDAGAAAIEVATLSGHTWQLSASVRTTGADLRARIAELADVPRHEVMLMCGADVLADEEVPVITKAALMHGPAPQMQMLRTKQQLALSGASDGSIKLWKVGHEELQMVATLSGHKSRVNCMSVDWQQRCALSGSSDGFLKLWDIDTRCCIDTLGDQQSDIKCLSVDWPGRQALASDVAVLRLWDLDEGVCLATLRGHGSEIYAMGASWGSMLAFTGYFEGWLCIWNLQTRTQLAALHEHLACVTCIVMDADAGQALSGSNDGLLKRWDTDRLTCVMELRGGWAELKSLSVDWPSEWAISGSERGIIKHWDLRDGVCLRKIQGQSNTLFDGINTIQMDWSKMLAVTGGTNGNVKLWDLGAEPCIFAEYAHGPEVRVVCIDAPEAAPRPDADPSQCASSCHVGSDAEEAGAESAPASRPSPRGQVSADVDTVSAPVVHPTQEIEIIQPCIEETPQLSLPSRLESCREIDVRRRHRRRWMAVSLGLAVVSVVAFALRRRFRRR